MTPMKIGIVVYSQTGNTLKVAKRLEEKLSGEGHKVKREEIKIGGEAGPGSRNIEFKSKPGVDPYDGVVFAAPVHAFSLASPMKAYLGDVGPLAGKKLGCFVTKALRSKWSGGTGAVKKMKKLCEARGGKMSADGIVVWKDNVREGMIGEVLGDMSRAFK